MKPFSDAYASTHTPTHTHMHLLMSTAASAAAALAGQRGARGKPRFHLSTMSPDSRSLYATNGAPGFAK